MTSEKRQKSKKSRKQESTFVWATPEKYYEAKEVLETYLRKKAKYELSVFQELPFYFPNGQGVYFLKKPIHDLDYTLENVYYMSFNLPGKKNNKLKVSPHSITRQFKDLEGKVFSAKDFASKENDTDLLVPHLRKKIKVIQDQRQKNNGSVESEIFRGLEEQTSIVQTYFAINSHIRPGFHCPVTLEYFSLTNPAYILECKHHISQTAYSKLIDEDLLECPLCKNPLTRAKLDHSMSKLGEIAKCVRRLGESIGNYIEDKKVCIPYESYLDVPKKIDATESAGYRIPLSDTWAPNSNAELEPEVIFESPRTTWQHADPRIRNMMQPPSTTPAPNTRLMLNIETGQFVLI